MFSVSIIFKSANSSVNLPKLLSILTSFPLFLLNAPLAKVMDLYLAFTSVTTSLLLQMLFKYVDGVELQGLIAHLVQNQ